MNKKLNSRIKKIERFCIYRCVMCETDLSGDPYQITFEDGSKAEVCDECGKKLCRLMHIDVKDVPEIEIFTPGWLEN